MTPVGVPAGVCVSREAGDVPVSKCETCGLPDSETILVKCQWYGRGTKWLCVDCLRAGSRPERSAARGDRRPAGSEVLRRERTR